jgi:hypothetical protein
MTEATPTSPRVKPPHQPLNSQAPTHWDGAKRVLEVMLTYAPHPKAPKMMVFQFVVTPIDYPEYTADPEYLNFGISDDCTLRFTLDPKISWRWSKDYWVISSKKDYRRLYGDVKKIGDHSFEVKAKYDANGSLGTLHHFNLNVDYGQGPDRWLPMTIDPDVGNPRPPGMVGVTGPIVIVPSGEVSEV